MSALPPIRTEPPSHLTAASADFREQRLLRSLDLQNNGYVLKQDFEEALRASGIPASDPRLAATLAALRKWEDEPANRGLAETTGVPGTVLSQVLRPNILLIEKALQGRLVIPDFESFCEEIRALYEEALADRSGAPATYIPQLALSEPEVDRFGVSICTIDGQRFSLGDSDVFFTAQSTSKAITYCLALEEHGEEVVHRYIGREPSGVNFAEIKLNPRNQPHNPLINAGAILACSLIRLSERREMLSRDRGAIRGWAGRRFDWVMSQWKALSGGVAPRFNNSVYLSERETADRNFALGHFMREKGAFPPNTDLFDVLELYFQCCSIEVTADMMGTIAATLANGGMCPVSGDRIFSTKTVRDCLSLMYSCGMYDFSGEFAFTIGLPAKSGVSGALMLVVPDVMGICCWSPRLDQIGNSVRGIRFSQGLVSRYNFHNYDFLGGSAGKRDPRKSTAQNSAAGVNALMWAVTKGDITAVQHQVMMGADLGVADYDGRTPLHLAATEGQLEMVAFLLEKHAEGALPQLNPVDRWGGTPLDDAYAHDHSEVVQCLTRSGATRGDSAQPPAADFTFTPNPTLHPLRIVEMIWAASKGELRTILRLVARGIPVDCADYDARTPLHLAASEGHEPVVRYLLAHGADTAPTDRWGSTPLDDARRHGHAAVVEALRSARPRWSNRNESGAWGADEIGAADLQRERDALE